MSLHSPLITSYFNFYWCFNNAIYIAYYKQVMGRCMADWGNAVLLKDQLFVESNAPGIWFSRQVAGNLYPEVG